MNDVRILRAPTIFSQFQVAGYHMAIVTAKDKLRAVAFSPERSGATTKSEHGIETASEWLVMPVPEVYSAELFEFVFAAGVKLLREFKPGIMYLSTTDHIQHKFAPEQQGCAGFPCNVRQVSGTIGRPWRHKSWAEAQTQCRRKTECDLCAGPY